MIIKVKNRTFHVLEKHYEVQEDARFHVVNINVQESIPEDFTGPLMVTEVRHATSDIGRWLIAKRVYRASEHSFVCEQLWVDQGGYM